MTLSYAQTVRSLIVRVFVLAVVLIILAPPVVSARTTLERYYQDLQQRALETAPLRGPLTSEQAQARRAPWTILVYMAADNDLEPFAIADLNEMELFGSSENVNVIVQIDRSSLYDRSNADWEGTRRYFVTNDNSLVGINSELVADLGEVNMGDPQTLADFATWGVQTYPADRYALILWDHGASWFGIGIDATSENDLLTLPELRQGLSTALEQTGLPRFDIIGFDACLMGAFEVYQAVSSFARYAVASPELAPGFGWDYANLIDQMATGDSLDAEAVGRIIVDTFYRFYTEDLKVYDIFTLALVDLARSDEVLAALDRFASVARTQPSSVVDAIDLARNSTVLYGGNDDPQILDIWSAADAPQFMQEILQQTTNTALTQAAEDANEALESMVLYYRASDSLAGLGGVSLYFPRTLSLYESEGRSSRYVADTSEEMSVWQNLLTVFFGRASFQNAGSNPLAQILSLTSSFNQQALFELGITDFNNISQIAFYASLQLENNRSILVHFERLSPARDRETVSAAWDNVVPVLWDGGIQVPVLLIPSRTAPGTGIVNGTYFPQGGPSVPAQLVIDLQTSQVKSVWGLRQTPAGAALSEIFVQPGDTFRPSWLSINEDGSFNDTPADASVTLNNRGELDFRPSTAMLTFSERPLTLVRLSVLRGRFNFGFNVQDATGTTLTTEAVGELVNGEPIVYGFSPDSDFDAVPDELDNCAETFNADQLDRDGDGVGDACDVPETATPVPSSTPTATPTPTTAPTSVPPTPLSGTPEVDYRARVTLSGLPVASGGTFVVNVSVDNCGTLTSGPAVVNGPVTIANASVLSFTAAVGTYNPATGIWTIPSIPSGCSPVPPLTLNVEASGPAGSPVTYSVLVSADPREPASVHANNAASASFIIGSSATTYVDAAIGSDTNACDTIAAPCRTIAAAYSRTTPGGTINIAAGTYAGGLLFNYGVTLLGAPGAVISGGGTVVTAVNSLVSISNLTITGGTVGVAAFAGSVITIDTSSIYGNTTGISPSPGTIINLTNSSVVANGTGINNGGTVNVTNTLIAANSGAACAGNPVTSNGYNLASDTTCNAGLTQFSDLTSAPVGMGLAGYYQLPNAGSPGIDQGDCALGSKDQTGLVRPVDDPAVPNPTPVGNGCDIGAIERP